MKPGRQQAHLAAANQRSAEVRSKRSALKREIKAGEVRPSELLAEPTLPDWLQGMEVGQLIAAIPRVSADKAHKLCEELWMPPFKRVGTCTYRQRRELAKRLTKWERPEPDSSGRRARPKSGSRGLL